MTGAIVGAVAAATESNQGGDQQWLLLLITGVLIPIVGTIVALIRRKNGLDNGTSAPKPQPTPPETMQAPVPQTAEGKLDAAKELFLELRRDRDETKTELAAMRERHAEELDALRRQHALEIGQMQTRMRNQDGYIHQLERLLGVPPGGQQPPPPPQLPWPGQGQQ